MAEKQIAPDTATQGNTPADSTTPIRLAFAPCTDYTTQALRPALEHVLHPQIKAAGGVSGKSVMLKPNLLAWRKANDPQAVNPRFIVETAKVFLDAGASRVAILENPAVQTTPQILRAMGISDELKSLGVDAANFTNYRKQPPLDAVCFRNLEIADEFREYDFVADLAKAKTHGMMTLTFCVKNLFGLVNGGDRLAWHLAVGRDYDKFADMLIDLYLVVRPAFNLLDAVTCMEGNGPGSGTPTDRNFIAGGTDALALDAAAARVLGVDPDELHIIKRAKARGLFPAPESVGILDTPPVCEPLALPERPVMDMAQLHLGVGIPRWIQKPLYKALVVNPKVDPDKCVGCGVCVKMCPPKSLKLSGGKPDFDLPHCIRCFCCQEHCPKGAIEPKMTRTMRFVKAVDRLFRGTKKRKSK
jgi:uncharacterized protein (DUF362 family)/Pyruvate/2-oxoacid:ferredoxin oxidoreductase delta subunit